MCLGAGVGWKSKQFLGVNDLHVLLIFKARNLNKML